MVWRVIIFLFTFYLLPLQGVIAQHADCDNMLKVNKKEYTTKPISGFGEVKEFEGNSLDNAYFFEEETHSIWYLITVPDSGIFTFDIKTQSEQNDWDFILFEHKKAFCKRIRDKKIKPIRTNLSRSPITGLKKGATQKFVGAGVNDNYSQPVIANKGDQFVLAVNNPKQSGRTHTLILYYPEPVKQVEPIVEVVSDKTVFNLSIKDKDTKQGVSSNIIITGLQKKEIEKKGVKEYKGEFSKKNYDVDITVSAKGYMLTSKQVQLGKNKSKHNIIMYLEKIKSGQKVNLKNIQFYGNRYDFLPSARSSLKALFTFMQENEKVKIEVEGHVNGPNQKNTKDYKQLSYNRAYAVKQYLMKNGIAKDRIDFTGYGNSQMLYPNPKSEYQQSANRRVEIKIISNDFNSGNRNFH